MLIRMSQTAEFEFISLSPRTHHGNGSVEGRPQLPRVLKIHCNCTGSF